MTMLPALHLKTQLKMTPRLVLASKLLRATGAEIDDLLAQEADANPALQCDRPEPWRQRSVTRLQQGPVLEAEGTRADPVERIADRPSALDVLAGQVVLLCSGQVCRAAMRLLHCLDHRGYLIAPLEELVEALPFELDVLEAALKVLHELDPPGIGARSVQECLILQCVHLEAMQQDCGVACQLLEGAWEEYLHQHLERAARRIDQPLDSVKRAADFIRANCYPYPLGLLDDPADRPAALYGPDLIIHRNTRNSTRKFWLEIPGEDRRIVGIDPAFQTCLQDESPAGGRLSARERAWVRSHVDRAQMVIWALGQRWQTLRRIGEFLTEFQRAYLEGGSQHLRPLTRAQVARRLDLHESTVSRAVREKVVQLPDGRLAPFDHFFDHTLPAKTRILQIVEQARRPLSDREIAKRLQECGYPLARRTVTKYRRQMTLPNSHQRRSGNAYEMPAKGTA